MTELLVAVRARVGGNGFPKPLGWTFVPLATVLSSSFLASRMPRLTSRFAGETLGGCSVLDTLCLTAVLALTGGPMNPFRLLYLVQITLWAVVLRKWWAWALGLFSRACFALLFFFNVPSVETPPQIVQALRCVGPREKIQEGTLFS